MPANMSTNRLFLPRVVFFGTPGGSHLASLSKVARIEDILVFVNLELLRALTFRFTRSPCARPSSA